MDSSGIHAVKKKTGEGIWEYKFSSEVPFKLRPLITVTSTNYVFITEPSMEGGAVLKAFDIKSGKEAWKFVGELSKSVAPTVIQDKLYIPTAGKILIINEKDGKELHSFKPKGVINSFAASDKQIIVVNISGTVNSYDSSTGKQLWEYDNELLGIPQSPVVMILKDKVMLTEIKSGRIIALDASTGNEE